MEQMKNFLASQRVGDLLKHHPKAVVYLRPSSTVGDALEGLAKHNVLSEPVLDFDDEYCGALSVGDILKSLIKTLDERDPHWNEKMEEMTAEELLFVGRRFCDTPVEKLQHAGELWLLEADESSSLLDALLESLRTQDPHVHHRMFVCSPAHGEKVKTSGGITSVSIKTGTDRASASGLKVHGVVSQSDVVQLMWENKQLLGAAGAATVEDLGLDGGAVFTAPCTMTALEAFGYMARDHKSSMGLTDSAGALVANISASDIRGLNSEDFGMLLLPAAEFVLVKSGKGGITMDEAREGKRIPDVAAALKAVLPVTSVGLATPLEEVLSLLATKHYHRVYVTDAQSKPLSIITLTDVLKLVTK